MAKRKTKYTLRSDGRIAMSKMYDGKRKYFYGSSDREVEAKAAAYEAELLKVAEPPRCRTMKQAVDDYWAWKETLLSPNSHNQYNVACKRIKAEWDDTPVNEITVQQVYVFLDSFRIKGFSSKVISNTRSVLSGVFDRCIIAGEINANPVKSVPTVTGKPRKHRQPASDSDIVKLDKHKTDTLFTRLYYFALLTGLRRGELAALQFKHIDLNKQCVYVKQNCAWDYQGQPVIKTPKSDAGERVVDLLEDAIAVLPPFGKPDDYVFFPEGLPTRGKIERALVTARSTIGITSTPHQFRHSFASIGHSAGIDAFDMQHELGHSTISQTLDIYTDLENRHRRRVRKKLNKYIKNNPLSDLTKK